MTHSRSLIMTVGNLLPYLPTKLWGDLSDDELEILKWGVTPYLKGMTKDLLGEGAFEEGVMRGKKLKVKRKKSFEVERRLLIVGKPIPYKPPRYLSPEQLEELGLSYIQKGLLCSVLLYKYVFLDGDTSPYIGRLSQAATRGLAVGSEMIQRARNGHSGTSSDSYLRIQRVPRVNFSTIILDFEGGRNAKGKGSRREAQGQGKEEANFKGRDGLGKKSKKGRKLKARRIKR